MWDFIKNYIFLKSEKFNPESGLYVETKMHDDLFVLSTVLYALMYKCSDERKLKILALIFTFSIAFRFFTIFICENV